MEKRPQKQTKKGETMQTNLTQQTTPIEDYKADWIDLGAILKTNYDANRTEMEKYMLLYKVKQRKTYKQQGMTWEDFCKAIGESRETVDRNLRELQPIIQNFIESSNQLLGMELSRVKLLARSIKTESIQTEAGSIVVNGEAIPFDDDHKEEIEIVIDELIEDKKKADKEKRSAKKELMESIERKDSIIQKLRQNIKKYEAEMAENNCSAEELQGLKNLTTYKETIEALTSQLMPGNFIHEQTTPKLKAAYFSILAYMKQMADCMWNEISPNRPPELMDAGVNEGRLLPDANFDNVYDDIEDTTNI